MAENDSFWDDAEQKDIKPSGSALLKEVGDFVHGEILDIFEVEYVPFGKSEPEKNADGSTVMQRGIAIQTPHRNWDGVSKRPTRKTEDGQKVDRTNEEDTGIRNVYLRKGTNIFYALGDALKTASEKAGTKVRPEVGGTIGFKIVELRDTGKGKPLKVHAAQYVPPVKAAPADPFFEAPAAAAPAPQAAAPAPQAAAPAPQAAAPAADPWAASAPVDNGQPPF